MSEQVKALSIKLFKGTLDSMQRDIEAMSHDQLGHKLNDKARTAYDYLYEVAVVNRRISARIKGDDPGKWPFESWAVAPLELQTKEMIAKEIADSGAEFIAVIENYPAIDILTEIDFPHGKSSVAEMAMNAAWHTAYHDGQLNYVQEAFGDMEVHWDMS